MKFKKYFFVDRLQLYSLGFLLIILCLIFVIFRITREPSTDIEYKIIPIDSTQNSAKETLTPFDPNSLNERQWLDLGFTEKQVGTIMKYKNMIGGQFISKEQLKKCYAISDEKYAQIEPYILLSDFSPDDTYDKNYKFSQKEKRKLNISSKINPDILTQKDWEEIGLSSSQANSLLKYKNYLGGSFGSKENFRKSFVISDDYYHQLEKYLLLPEKSPTTVNKQQNINKKLETFDPNNLDLEGWKNIGFTEKQAIAILKYKNNYLKGRFKNIADLENNIIIKDKIEKLKPYIQIKTETTYSDNYKTTPTKEIKKEKQIDISNIDLNTVSVQELKQLGFSDRNALGIVAFKKSLGGFVNKNQIYETYGIDREKAENLVNNCKLSTDGVAKYSLIDAPESWLKTHPYFKHHADKIIYYRVSFPNEKKIWKQIKVSPEQESKMKMYLK